MDELNQLLMLQTEIHITHLKNAILLLEIKNDLVHIRSQLHTLNSKLDSSMADVTQQLKDAVARINDATNKAAQSATAISTRISKLEDTVKGMGLSQDQEQALLTDISGVADHADQLATSLEAMGKDPADAVPIAPPAASDIAPTGSTDLSSTSGSSTTDNSGTSSGDQSQGSGSTTGTESSSLGSV